MGWTMTTNATVEVVVPPPEAAEAAEAVVVECLDAIDER